MNKLCLLVLAWAMLCTSVTYAGDCRCDWTFLILDNQGVVEETRDPIIFLDPGQWVEVKILYSWRCETECVVLHPRTITESGVYETVMYPWSQYNVTKPVVVTYSNSFPQPPVLMKMRPNGDLMANGETFGLTDSSPLQFVTQLVDETGTEHPIVFESGWFKDGEPYAMTIEEGGYVIDEPGKYTLENDYVEPLSFTASNLEASLVVEELKQKVSIKLFPNPAEDELKFETDLSYQSTLSYRIYSISGREVSNGMASMNGSNGTIPVQNLAPGVHLLVFEHNGQNITQRFVKK